MANRISASELARRLGDILGRVRYRGESFLVERHDVAIARIAPVGASSRASLSDAAAAWHGASTPDGAFADVLERVDKADRPPRNPWDS